MIDISNMNKAKVLAALYNNSKPLGMGFLHFNPKPMNELEAQNELDRNERKYFDYLHGRVMKAQQTRRTQRELRRVKYYMTNKIFKSISIFLMGLAMIGCADDAVNDTTAYSTTDDVTSTTSDMETTGITGEMELKKEYEECDQVAENCEEGLLCSGPADIMIIDKAGGLVDLQSLTCGEVCHQEGDCTNGEQCLVGFCVSPCDHETQDEPCTYGDKEGICRMLYVKNSSQMGFFCWVK